MSTQSKNSLKIKELVVFSMLGTIMFISKIVMEFLPNVHLLGALTMVFTIVYRKKALLPIYIFVALTFVFNGLSLMMMPYIYIWTILWAVTMALPKKMPKPLAYIVYPVVCALHGLAFGILYSPGQALMFGLDFEQTIAWIITGLPWDAIHCVGNFCAGLLILPLAELIKKIDK